MPTLREARVRRMLSVRDLAEHAQVGANTITLIENGHVQRPHFRTMVRLAKALELDVAEIEEFAAALERFQLGSDD